MRILSLLRAATRVLSLVATALVNLDVYRVIERENIRIFEYIVRLIFEKNLRKAFANQYE